MLCCYSELNNVCVYRGIIAKHNKTEQRNPILFPFRADKTTMPFRPSVMRGEKRNQKARGGGKTERERERDRGVLVSRAGVAAYHPECHRLSLRPVP